MFFEPGSAAQVAAELRSLERGRGGRRRAADGGDRGPPAARLRHAAAAPRRRARAARPRAAGAGGAAGRARSLPTRLERTDDGAVADGAYRQAPLFETNADGVFCALQGRRLPARRHPLGHPAAHRRADRRPRDGRRAATSGTAASRRSTPPPARSARTATRSATRRWLGDPAEGVVVLPGSSVPDEFPTEGVLPPVERLQLPPVTEALAGRERLAQAGVQVARAVAQLGPGAGRPRPVGDAVRGLDHLAEVRREAERGADQRRQRGGGLDQQRSASSAAAACAPRAPRRGRPGRPCVVCSPASTYDSPISPLSCASRMPAGDVLHVHEHSSPCSGNIFARSLPLAACSICSPTSEWSPGP